ncbi:longitudinals lacking protein-like [Nilaparvata lugens]|uniref:longitudinals lacking protein-like n=1 Tax=Nilaparvata lugens TaxID=108931 RepID=UPI00193D5C03|nr:longitudinals lacking protein-like [Nilaparvata lugens]
MYRCMPLANLPDNLGNDGSVLWPQHSLLTSFTSELAISNANQHHHHQQQSAADKKHACRNCGKVYALASSLYTHEKYQCGKEPQFKCPYCPHKTKLKGNLKAHIGFKHSNMPKDF